MCLFSAKSLPGLQRERGGKDMSPVRPYASPYTWQSVLVTHMLLLFLFPTWATAATIAGMAGWQADRQTNRVSRGKLLGRNWVQGRARIYIGRLPRCSQAYLQGVIQDHAISEPCACREADRSSAERERKHLYWHEQPQDPCPGCEEVQRYPGHPYSLMICTRM